MGKALGAEHGKNRHMGNTDAARKSGSAPFPFSIRYRATTVIAVTCRLGGETAQRPNA